MVNAVLVWLFLILCYIELLPSRSHIIPRKHLAERTILNPKQQLVLISGCTGTGKSTFAMEVAISRDILKCISTDTIRQVTRDFDNSLAVQRSSYVGTRDPIVDWRESCTVLERSINNVVADSMNRGINLVLEGVHLVPDRKLLDMWTAAGGIAIGIALCIPDADVHRKVLNHRGDQTKKGAAEQIKSFERIRSIHDEIMRLGHESDWLIIEQTPNIDPRPIDILNYHFRSN